MTTVISLMKMTNQNEKTRLRMTFAWNDEIRHI